MTGDAEHGGEGIEGREGGKAKPCVFRQQDIESRRRRADVDDAERHLSQREQRARKLEIADNRRVPPAHAADPGEIGDHRADDSRADEAIGEGMEMVDLGHRIGRREEARPDHQSHAEPERDPRHDRQARDLAGGEAYGPVDPVADRSPRHQRKPERERKRVAGEGRERRQPVGNLDPEVAERQRVIAGEREVAQPGEGEGEGDLIAAGPGDRRLDLVRVDANERADENRRREWR